MADLKLLQQSDRTQHTTNSGMEIIRTFNCEPYEAHGEVIKALQGSVAKDDGERWVRTPPSHDTYIRNCYCMETRVDFWDKDAMASSPNIEFEAETINNKLEDTPEQPAVGAAGAKISAHYRPLITAWESSSELSPDPQIWDWMDPKVIPGVRELPWPDGLYVTTDEQPLGLSHWNVPNEVASPLQVPIADVFIRRMFVGEPPWDLIQVAANALNKDVFPSNDLRVGKLLPTFQPRTLKFIDAEVINMIDTTGVRWFEITYHFKWIHLWADYRVTAAGVEGEGWVTWNDVFHRPWQALTYKTGWYEVARGEAFRILDLALPNFVSFLGVNPVKGRLHYEMNFEPLFELNPAKE